jgi:NitT/TauT family transport system permease protein
MAELVTQPVVGTPVRTPRRMRRGVFLPIVSFALLLGVWEIAVDSGFLESIDVPVYVIPAPSAIVARFIGDPGYIIWHSAFTGGAALAGFGLALLVGSVLAILLTYSRPLERALYPYLIITKVVPIVAVAPILAIWFGFGITPKIVVSFLIAFFPIVVNLILGLRSPERGMIMLMRSMNAREVDTFRKIRLPFALPLLFAACRVAAPTTVIGAIVAEFVGSDVGLGYVITTAKGYLHTDTMFLALFASSFLGIAMFLAVVLVESRVLRWHESQG